MGASDHQRQDWNKIAESDKKAMGVLLDAQEETYPRGYRRFRLTQLAVVQGNSTIDWVRLGLILLQAVARCHDYGRQPPPSAL